MLIKFRAIRSYMRNAQNVWIPAHQAFGEFKEFVLNALEKKTNRVADLTKETNACSLCFAADEA